MMRLSSKLAFTSIVFGLATSAGAHAAVLTASGTSVKVDGKRPASAVTTVRPGSLVAVGQNGSAVLQYGNGCSFSLKAGQVVRVPSTPPSCTGATSSPAADTIVPIIVGGAIIGGGIAIATSGSSNKPASP
jgi:hypothetical protein